MCFGQNLASTPSCGEFWRGNYTLSLSHFMAKELGFNTQNYDSPITPQDTRR